jgi:O-antigen biosynthesis protein WbqP
MKRLLDIVLVIVAAILVAIPTIIIGIMIKITSEGNVLYWSDRIGRDNKIFKMPKFRTMRSDTPAVATHLLINPAAYITPLGTFLRKSSLDEVPQLWNIIRGEMSFVGPRPALFNQLDLIGLRSQAGVDKLLPGMTGWAQVNGRDLLSMEEKVWFDAEYLMRRSVGFDLWILWLTILRIFKWRTVSH